MNMPQAELSVPAARTGPTESQGYRTYVLVALSVVGFPHEIASRRELSFQLRAVRFQVRDPFLLDPAGPLRLSSISSNHTGSWTTIASNFLYQPATNQRYAWKFGNGLPRMMTQDSDGRVIQLDSQGVHQLVFSHNNTDTISGIADSIYGTNVGYIYDAKTALVQQLEARGI